MTRIRLNKKNLLALKLAKNSVKQHLGQGIQNVNVSSDGTVCTDGHSLVRVSLPDNQPGYSDGGNFNVSYSDAEKIKDSFETGTYAAHFLQCNAENKLTVDRPSGIQVAEFEIADDKFPKFKTVTPASAPIAEIILDAGKLADIARWAAQFTENKKHCVKIRIYGKHDVVRFDCEANKDGQTFTALLMPINPNYTGEFPGDVPAPVETVAEPESEPETVCTNNPDYCDCGYCNPEPAYDAAHDITKDEDGTPVALPPVLPKLVPEFDGRIFRLED